MMWPDFREIMGNIESARARAKRRKSGWNFLLFPTVFISWLALAFTLLHGIDLLHQRMHPGQSLATNDTGFTVLLSSLPLLFAALPIGFIVGNSIVWLVPPARRVLDSEAKPYPGNDFFSAQMDLLKMAAFVTPAGLTLAVIGALLPW
jgi:hypothetical protein